MALRIAATINRIMADRKRKRARAKLRMVAKQIVSNGRTIKNIKTNQQLLLREFNILKQELQSLEGNDSDPDSSWSFFTFSTTSNVCIIPRSQVFVNLYPELS